MVLWPIAVRCLEGVPFPNWHRHLGASLRAQPGAGREQAGPTGLPANAALPHLSVMCHCQRRGSQLLLGQECHLHVFEQGGVAQVRTRRPSPEASSAFLSGASFLGTTLGPAEGRDGQGGWKGSHSQTDHVGAAAAQPPPAPARSDTGRSRRSAAPLWAPGARGARARENIALGSSPSCWGVRAHVRSRAAGSMAPSWGGAAGQRWEATRRPWT